MVSDQSYPSSYKDITDSTALLSFEKFLGSGAKGAMAVSSEDLKGQHRRRPFRARASLASLTRFRRMM